MQAQIEFSLRDGTRLMRTCTFPTRASSDKSEVLKSLNVSIIGLHVLHEAAQMALNNEGGKARERLFAAEKVLSVLKREDQREEHANFLRLAEELDATLRANASA